MSVIHDYQVDHLLLLVGANPVPNAVAGKLLTTTASTMTLIHSDDGLDLAQRLQAWFVDAGYSKTQIGFRRVEEASAASVSACVHEVLERYEYKVLQEYESDPDSANRTRLIHVGLSYTGGTKVMAVHAYRALENWVQDPGRNAVISRDLVCSYLDARTLHMHFDPARGRPAISFPVGRAVDLSIRDLLKLHNWELVADPVSVPVLPESANALLAVHSHPTDAAKWTAWLRHELFFQARKLVSLDPPFRVFQSGKELEGQFDVKQPDGWKSNSHLRSLALSWPDLPVLKEIMSNELEQGDASSLNLTAATGPGRCRHEGDFCKWLSGIWLESAVLSSLQRCPQELHLKEMRMDIKPRVPGSSQGELFQFDVVAIRGYQLFAFSCTTESKDRGLLKQKLFETYVRAQQMGGDEACAALICCAEQEKAEGLEAEMRRDLSTQGRTRVFGRDDLRELTGAIAAWVRQQSKEG